uniref:RNase H domain-containing protein n=1 Tax=Strongyloides papillosus TaxID=174720 RepID=A0A0N5B1U3_STREA
MLQVLELVALYHKIRSIRIRIPTDHKSLEKLRYTSRMSKHVELLSHIDKLKRIRIENKILFHDGDCNDNEKDYDDSNEDFNSSICLLAKRLREISEIINTLNKNISTKKVLSSCERTDDHGQFRRSHFTDTIEKLSIKLELATAYDSNLNDIVENKIRSVNKIILSLMGCYSTTSFCQLLY